MKKIILTALALFLVGAIAFAQELPKREVTLITTDAKGKTPKGLELYAFLNGKIDIFIADERGRVTIPEADDSDTLSVIISDIIYEFPLEGTDSIKLIVKNKKKLSGYQTGSGKVINTGYRTVSLKDNSTAAAAVDMAQINNYRDIASYIESRVAGVQVVRRGSVDLLIRGVGTFNNSTSPLIIVDGRAMPSFNMVNSTYRPTDIESITVLKDGALYGVRGGNGVVVITTKNSL